MLKRRLIPVLQLNCGVLTRSKCFRPDYVYTQSFLGSVNADEVVVLDITRHGGTIPPLEERAEFYSPALHYAKQCFSPLCIGGGVTSLQDAGYALRILGADKVIINTAAFDHPETLLEPLALKYGAQAVVVGIDFDQYGAAIVQQGARHTGLPAWEWAARAVAHGAGEIFLNSIERDGSLRGYDLDLLRKVVAAVDVPVVIAGGCGGPHHMAEAFEAGADGAATQNIFHLTDTSLKNFKDQLVKRGQPVRP